MEKQNTVLLQLILGCGTLIGSLNITMFNVALPIMMEYFHTDLSTVQWLTSGYILATGIIIPVAGYLGDRFGYKKTFCTVLFFVLLLSVIGTFAPNITVLIITRFIFGLFGGVLAPLTLAMLYKLMPADKQAKAASTWGIASVLGGMLPSVLSGIILSVASWHFLLLFNVPIVVVLLFFAVRYLPTDNAQAQETFDFPGLLLLAAGSFILMFTFSNLSKIGFSLPLFAGVLLGLSCLAVYLKKNLDNPEALLNLTVLKYRRFLAGFLTSGFVSVAMYMIVFLMPLFLQSGLGVSPLATGLIMLPASLFTVISMPIATKYYKVIGEKALAITGIVILVLGSTPFLIATPATPVIVIIIAMCIRCCGMGPLNLVNTNAQMSDVPAYLSGHASSLSNWFSQMLNAFIVGVASNVADIYMAQFGSGEIAVAYTSATNLMMAVSCTLLLMVIPVILKFYRSKEETA